MRCLPLALLAALLLVGPCVHAQDADAANTRVLRAWSEPVKLDAGPATYHHEIVLDLATGATWQVTRDDTGRLVGERPVRPPRPTPAEVDEAVALLMAQPRFQALRAARPFDADGGFLLVQDEGQPCGPGSRCLQLDLLDSSDRKQRVGYAVVDLIGRAVVYPDFVPARQGNRR